MPQFYAQLAYQYGGVWLIYILSMQTFNLQLITLSGPGKCASQHIYYSFQFYQDIKK